MEFFLIQINGTRVTMKGKLLQSLKVAVELTFMVIGTCVTIIKI